MDDGKSVVKFNDSIFYAYWLDYLHSLILHNYFFPDTAYTLLGFTTQINTSELPQLYAIVQQNFVETNTPTDLEEVKSFMKNNGFVNTRNNDYFNQDLGIILEDLHEENVLTKDGILFFIDTVFYVVKTFWKNQNIIQ